MVTAPRPLSRRRWLAAAAGACALAGCAVDMPAPAPPQNGPLRRVRVLQGGFLAPAVPPPRPGSMPAPAVPTGLYTRWSAPAALALQGQELLVADLAGQRLWRTDVSGQAMQAIAGAPVVPGVQLALGPDLSAWVLDAGARQVLRFDRGGRLLQSVRLPLALPSPAAMVLADGGATLLVADGLGAAWVELRGGAVVRAVSPEAASGQRISGCDGLAPSRAGLWVLDRLGGAVHEVARDGRVLRTLGQGELVRPVALAAERHGGVWVHDAGGAEAMHRLGSEAPPWKITAAQLGVPRIGAIAAEGGLVAVADAAGGGVSLWSAT